MCGVDDKTEPAYKVLCWEDITLWIVHDPYGNGGRDSVAPGLPTQRKCKPKTSIRPWPVSNLATRTKTQSSRLWTERMSRHGAVQSSCSA